MFLLLIWKMKNLNKIQTGRKNAVRDSLSFCGVQTGTAVLETNLTRCYQESWLYDAIILLTRLCKNSKTWTSIEFLFQNECNEGIKYIILPAWFSCAKQNNVRSPPLSGHVDPINLNIICCEEENFSLRLKFMYFSASFSPMLFHYKHSLT